MPAARLWPSLSVWLLIGFSIYLPFGRKRSVLAKEAAEEQVRAR
jgi:hypothetical protein